MTNPKCEVCGGRLEHYHTEFIGSGGDYMREQYFTCPKCDPDYSSKIHE